MTDYEPYFKPRREILHFAERMEVKLRANDHKKHWREMPNSYLLLRLKQEVGELIDAFALGGTNEQIADEAADVANFAMFIADKFKQPCEPTERLQPSLEHLEPT